jgi:uncharacterized protein YqeY
MLHAEIKNEVKAAMKAREALRLSVLRSMLAAFTNELVAKRRMPQEELADEEARAVVKRLARQRRDSITQFRAGGREDLASREEAELAVLEKYLPQEMPRGEIERIAREKIAALGTSGRESAGALMRALMQELKGKADGGTVREVVDALIK